MSDDGRAPDVLGLVEKIRPEHTAEVVVDYQNDFVASGGALDQVGQRSTELEGIHDSIMACLSLLDLPWPGSCSCDPSTALPKTSTCLTCSRYSQMLWVGSWSGSDVLGVGLVASAPFL